MERISVSDASLTLADLVDRVVQDGVAIDLERGDRVVARLSPVAKVSLTIDELNRMIQGWPTLGNDAEAFARDLASIRRKAPKESDAWD